MNNNETLDTQLPVILENLKKLDVDNEQLPSLEQYVHDEICALLDAESSIGEYIMTCWDPFQEDCDVQFSGSMVEGATMARCFQRKKDWREVEIDIMFNLFTIPQDVSHLLEPVEDKIGFVRLPFSKELCAGYYAVYAEIYLSDTKDITHCSGQMPQYISPMLIKDDEMNRAACLGPLGFMCSESKTETTREAVYDVLGVFHMNIDDVPAVRLQFWPQQAATWITRCRLWPPQDTIQSIADEGCNVVPRSSPGGDVHSEWRLSFSLPETSLAQLRTEEQKRAYYFFKIFFYQHLKCIESSHPEGKPLYSYAIKTTMLWASEELPPKDPIWASLETSAQMLLFKLLGSLQTGFLPHYFVPEINLLERVGEDVRDRCAAIISRWQSNILMTAPLDMPEKREWILFIRTFMSFVSEMTKSKDFWSAAASAYNHLGNSKAASIANSMAQNMK